MDTIFYGSVESLNTEVLENYFVDLLKTIFKRHQKFVSLDALILRLENLRRVFITSLFDCCRERVSKGSITKDDILAQSHTFYACRDGKYADAGAVDGGDNLSPMTGNWLQFVNGNPGGPYPHILKEF